MRLENSQGPDDARGRPNRTASRITLRDRWTDGDPLQGGVLGRVVEGGDGIAEPVLRATRVVEGGGEAEGAPAMAARAVVAGEAAPVGRQGVELVAGTE